jgi:hypothetical protein
MNLIDSFRNSFRRFVDDWLFENRYHHIELPLEVEYEHRRSSAIIETRYVLQKRKKFFFFTTSRLPVRSEFSVSSNFHRVHFWIGQ